MKRLLTGLCATLCLTATAAPVAASTDAVAQVVDWFTGFFDNADQVQASPEIPFLTMENCSVSALDGDGVTQYVHLEQFFGGGGPLLRSRAYAFSAVGSAVDLSVFSYQDPLAALGSCDQAMPSLDVSDLVSPSCDLTLVRREADFFGTNEPEGCPSDFPFPGSTVVSTVTITADTVDSLDTFLFPGGAIGTPIAFRRVSTPEPGLVVGLLVLSTTAVWRRRKS